MALRRTFLYNITIIQQLVIVTIISNNNNAPKMITITKLPLLEEATVLVLEEATVLVLVGPTHDSVNSLVVVVTDCCDYVIINNKYYYSLYDYIAIPD